MTLHKHDPMSWPITLATAAALPSDVTTVSLFQRYWLSDLKVMATAYGDHWEYSEIPSNTWANILAISSTSLKAGMTCKASDLSLHTFIWDGSNWQSLNKAPIKIGSSRTQVSTSATGPTTIYTQVLPAKLLGGGGRIICEIEASYTSSINAKHLYLAAEQTMLASSRVAAAGYFGVKARLVSMLNGAGAMYTLTNSGGMVAEPWYAAAASSVTFDQTVSHTLYILLAQASTEAASIFGYDLYVERITV